MEGGNKAAEEGLEIIEASYRLLADANAFDDVLDSWLTRIADVDRSEGIALEHPVLLHHLQSVTRLFDQVSPLSDLMQIARAAVAHEQPAMALHATGRVIAVNEAAEHAWSVELGGTQPDLWLDDHSRADFAAVLRSSASAAEQKHAVLRTYGPNGEPGVAEAFLIPADLGDERLMVVRGLALGWSDDVASTLASAFDLSGAEVEICRLLLDTRDTSEIARLRSTSVHTVRTQLRTIFSKTSTASQVDLIRLIAMLCAGTDNSSPKEADRWRDPLGRERTFRDGNGKAIAYSWIGDPEGRPALLSHGMATTYLLPPDAVALLKSSGVRLYLISRPGFGNSDPPSGGEPLHSAADAVCALANHLKVDGWPAIGLGAGLPPLIRAAANPQSRLTRLVGVAGYLPYPVSESFEGFPAARRIAFRLARSSMALADFVGRFCYRMAMSRTDEFVGRYMYSDCAADRDALALPFCRTMIPIARSFMTSHRHRAMAADLRMMAVDWSGDLTRCPININLIHGEDDPVNRLEFVRDSIGLNGRISLDVIPRQGELVAVENSQFIIRSLLDLPNSMGRGQDCEA